MKGAHKRFLDRQKQQLDRRNAANRYSSADRYLDSLFGSVPKSSDDTRQANLKVGQSYAVVCEDNPNYYRVVYLKQNPFTNSVQPLIANPTYGVIPDGIQEVSQQQLFRFLNFNRNLQNANKAFPTMTKDAVDKYKRWSSSEPTTQEREVMDIDNTVGIDEALTGQRQMRARDMKGTPYQKGGGKRTARDNKTLHNLATRNEGPGTPGYEKKSTGGKGGKKYAGYGDQGAGNKAARRAGNKPMRGNGY